ncbi:MAG: undecaprenyl-diphosphate phosphatase [Flavobacteriia bacterium]|nr:undecaprenyl-diphosphate phosphatase [Flavobacteriia bacterium]
MTFLQAIVLAIIEGLTEFLPVSSTAHMIFTSSIFGVEKDVFVKMFQVSIQFGAILAVVVLYWKKFFDFTSYKFYLKITLAVIPALILGKLFDDKIESVLEKPIPIAITLIIGGIVLLFIHKLFNNTHIDKEQEVSNKSAITIGFWQCLAMMPGTSRSAASIIGGMQQGLTMRMAAEFSFFLAVPTMLAVTGYSIFLKDWSVPMSGGDFVAMKGYEMLLQGNHLLLFIIGNVIAFIVALLAIKFFIGILKKYGFKMWGWYRILLGISFIIYYCLLA